MIDAVYLRVSTWDQSVRSQVPDLKKWADANSPEAIWYEDHFTGRSMRRPTWDRLWARIQAGEVRRLVVWRLDRLGRTAGPLVQLLEELQRLQVTFVSLREGIDLDTPAGRLVGNILASVAAYDYEVRRERQAAGIAAARKSGKTWGGSQKGRRLKLSPGICRQVKQLHNQGMPKAQIARALEISIPSVYQALRLG